MGSDEVGQVELGKVLNQANTQRIKHSERTSRLIFHLGQRMGLPETSLAYLRQGMLMHDIGKTEIPDQILTKREPLTQDEWKVMKRHPEIGYKIVCCGQTPPEVAEMVLYHHENWDGTGYPKQLKGEEIPLFARMAAIVEVWDALLHVLPYRPAWKKNDALEYIRQEAGLKFDPELAAVFIEIMSED